jgi:hypothetical protein
VLGLSRARVGVAAGGADLGVAQRGALQVEDVGGVDETIADRVGQGRLADGLVPGLDASGCPAKRLPEGGSVALTAPAALDLRRPRALSDGVGPPSPGAVGADWWCLPNRVGRSRLCGATLQVSGNNAQRNRTGKSLVGATAECG